MQLVYRGTLMGFTTYVMHKVTKIVTIYTNTKACAAASRLSFGNLMIYSIPMPIKTSIMDNAAAITGRLNIVYGCDGSFGEKK
ncbi:hypothetical protein DCPSUM001_26790 [Dysgonomonas capnocytophagoides]|nr:hypothetical protein DCPSUM001_26790 [Dysgonomonas capnocytophagoides]